MSTMFVPLTAQSELQDEEVVARVLAGETALFEILMRRYNQRLYRMSRMILRNDGEAEDVMQDAYVRAYEHLDQFAGKAAFSTWLTRIAIHEALARKRRRGRMEELDALPENGDFMSILKSSAPSPEDGTATAQARELLEQAIDHLPEAYRGDGEEHPPQPQDGQAQGQRHQPRQGSPRRHRGPQPPARAGGEHR